MTIKYNDYTIQVRVCDEDEQGEGFVAGVVELPFLGAWGKTRAEAVELCKSRIRDWFGG